jgi:NitT/TauT family transport system ATP-binding protein
MSVVEVSNISFSYAAEEVLSEVSFSVNNGEVVSIMGPSGCGKSTLLRLIAGLETPIAGRIASQGAASGNNPKSYRFLFQDYDAYPWFTVWQNVQAGSGPKPQPPDNMIAEMLSLVGLDEHRNKYPGELSGGMRKRLALARCLVRRPALLLLDEPFSSLDVDAKYSMYELVQRLWRETGCAVIMVTHELQEAILLADRVLVSTAKPMSIRETVSIPFPRPRNDSIADTPEYMQIRRQLASALRHSSGRSGVALEL